MRSSNAHTMIANVILVGAFSLVLLENFGGVVCPPETEPETQLSPTSQPEALQRAVSFGSIPPGSKLMSIGELRKVPRAFRRFHELEATHILPDMTVKQYREVRKYIADKTEEDNCPFFNWGSRAGRFECMQEFFEFTRIPRPSRGLCADVVLFSCLKWAIPGSPKMCSFFVKTSPDLTPPVVGKWYPVQVCLEGMMKV